VVEGFDRPPEWSPESVVQKWSDEEMVIGEPSGVDYGEIVVPGAESILETTPFDRLPGPSVLEGPEPWRDTDLFSESDVRLGLVPPPELVARELVERTQTGREVTPKKWPSDWYARRYERADDDLNDEAADGLDDSMREAIAELVRTEGLTSVPSVLGRLQIDPDRADEVSEVVKQASRVN
jgi:hypothetical protein